LNLTGVVAAALVVDRGNLRIVSGPHLSARGITQSEETHLSRVAQGSRALLEELSPAVRGDDAFLRGELVRVVRRAFKQEFGRKPTVVPLVVYL
jgi:ribonuclease J